MRREDIGTATLNSTLFLYIPYEGRGITIFLKFIYIYIYIYSYLFYLLYLFYLPAGAMHIAEKSKASDLTWLQLLWDGFVQTQ